MLLVWQLASGELLFPVHSHWGRVLPEEQTAGGADAAADEDAADSDLLASMPLLVDHSDLD